MKQFLKCALLSCLVSMFLLDTAMGQLSQRTAPQQTTTRDVVYKGAKLGIDTPLSILRELADGGWSDRVPDNMTIMGDTWATAKFYLAQCYLLGRNGCARDEKKAAELFQESFRDTYLYWLLYDALGREQRIVPDQRRPAIPVGEALALHVERKREEAAKGDRNALYALGIYYALAMGVQKNLPEAEKNFRKAAELGHREAQFNLGVYHANPTLPGVSQDMREAEKWLRLAAGQGHDDAKIMLDEIAEERRERQIRQQPQPQRQVQPQPQQQSQSPRQSTPQVSNAPPAQPTGWSDWQPANRLDSRTQARVLSELSSIIDGHVNAAATRRINNMIADEIRAGRVRYRTNNSGWHQIESAYGSFILRPNGSVEWQF